MSFHDQPVSADLLGGSDAKPAERTQTNGRSASRRTTIGWWGAGAATLLLSMLAVWLIPGAVGQRKLHATGQKAGTSEGETVASGAANDGEPEGIPVHTVQPLHKTLVRTITLPGSIKPWAQAELYAKVSGYLKAVQRETTAQMVASMVGGGSAPPLASAAGIMCPAQLAAVVELSWWQAPEKDIGSQVQRGELLLEIASPERMQEIVERETFYEQREAERDQARTSIATFEAAVLVAKAQKLTAEADIRKCEADQLFYKKQLQRLQELVRREAVNKEVAEEKQHQVDAAFAAWETALARLQSVHAELSAANSKLATARADLRVKEVLVRVARDELERAIILAEYAHLHAPFDGIITYRDLDEGDFVQNATSGQTRLLMTVTSLDRIKVVLNVPAREAVLVQQGAEAVLQVDALPGWAGKGRVARLGHTLDPQTRTMRVEIDLDNPGRRLKPGMYGQVTLALQKIPDAWAIPATAVYSRKGENFILLVDDEGHAHRQRVHISYDDGKELVVAKVVGDREVPLDGTEVLIVSNKGEIADGQHVKPIADNED